MARKPKQTTEQSNVDPDLMLEALKWYAEQRGEIASIQQDISTGLARYEKQGINRRALKVAYQAQSSDATAEEIAAQRRAEDNYLRWAGIITVEEDGQTSMVSGLEPRRPSAKAAHKLTMGKVKSDGYNTGHHSTGTLDDNPHTNGTEEYAVWAEAFAEGRADQLQQQELPPLPVTKRTRKVAPPAETAEEATARAQAHLSGGDMPTDPA